MTPVQIVLTFAYLGGIGFLLTAGCGLIARFARPAEAANPDAPPHSQFALSSEFKAATNSLQATGSP